MTFRRKVVLLPSLAGVAVALILIATVVLVRRNAGQLSRIELGYAPSLDLSRTLESTLDETQHVLQNAVGASDLDELARADSLHRLFATQAEAGRTNPVIVPA